MTQLKCHLLQEAFHVCLSNIDHHLASMTLYHLISLLRLSEQSLPISAMTFFICMLFGLLSLLLSHQNKRKLSVSRDLSRLYSGYSTMTQTVSDTY